MPSPTDALFADVRPTRVLLISPVPELDPPSGDVVYTNSLLAHPPANVQYETYPQAIEAGRLRELARRDDFQSAAGGTNRLVALGRIGRERAINSLRRRGILFREPFRYFQVERHTYDLVHCHVFSAAFVDLDAPLVMSSACAIEDLYRGARQWPDWRVGFASRADAILARGLRVQHTSHAMPAASAVVCFTETFRNELSRRRSVDAVRLHVAPCFVEPGPRLPASDPPRTIGFVASDFDAKGGATVLKAFELVRNERPDAELMVIGSPPRGTRAELAARGIKWYARLSRSELLEEYMPLFDVFAYPTEFDGLPLTILEVMARGIPIATSDYQAMPEIVGHGRAGSVTPQRDSDALAQAILFLLDPAKNAKARRQAADWFDTHYTPGVAVSKLGTAYDAAIRFHTYETNVR
jgi:glycosyltransferase involved in cell wall biosynthesis